MQTNLKNVLMGIFAVIAAFLLVYLIYLIFYRIREQRLEDQSIYISDEKNRFRIERVEKTENKDTFQRIPKIIHQTFKENEMDIEYYETCMINKYMNNEYEYRFYTNEDVDRFIQTHFPQYMKAYNMLNPGAYKADLFRYLVLYKEGGVYMDCKSSTIFPLRMFISPDIGFVSFRDALLSTIQISFIAAVPKHPLLKLCIDISIDNILNKRYGQNNLDITGPQVCGRALNRLLNRDDFIPFEEKRYDEVDVEILGTQKFTGKNKYQVLYNKDNKPLVARTCGSYHKNWSIFSFFTKNATYGQQWASKSVFN